MALKFLNKKGWHTGSLRNLEIVWKAEQKQEAEQRKLDELRKQIEEERERAEFRQLQEQAGLIPRQERLDFLYESGLAVGKSSSEGFRSAEVLPGTDGGSSAAAAANKQSSTPIPAPTPGALFEEKPQSANDSWRKLHSDPLLLIRQQEQEALARIKNNPVKMAMIRKSVEEQKKMKEEERKSKKHKHHKKKRKHSSEDDSDSDRPASEEKHKKKRYRNDDKDLKKHKKHATKSEDESEKEKVVKRKTHRGEDEHHGRSKHTSGERFRSDTREEESRRSSHSREYDNSKKSRDKSSAETDSYTERSTSKREADKTSRHHREDYGGVSADHRSTKNVEASNFPHGAHYKRPPRPSKLSAEEKAARAREMQLDAEIHEEGRWKRLKKASEADAKEAANNAVSRGPNFLDSAQKSIYGTEKGGSASVEESVRRRAHYLQSRSSHDENAFRR